jgi:ATP-dependent 26S proteasome regulatory subunit
MIGKETWLTGKAIIPHEIRLKESPKENNMENQNTTSLKSFHYLEDGNIDFSILETKYSTKQLEPRVYNLDVIDSNQGLVAKLSVCEDREQFNSDLGFYYEDKISNIYSKFFMPEIKEKVNQLGYNHKLGILLYGKQGTGKTSMFKKYFNDAVINHNAIVFNIRGHAPKVWWKLIQDIRKVQDNPILVFIDEADSFFNYRYDCEQEFKTFLDGTDSIDNSLFMLTTNYIDKIPETIKNRPSRIKYVIEVEGIQDTNIITRFLEQSFAKIDIQVDFSNEVNKMKGWTIDELKQWILDKVMDIEPEEKEKKRLGF